MNARIFGVVLLLVLHAGCTGFDPIEHKGILVDAAFVANRLESKSGVIVHVGTKEVYDSIHLPGAIHIHPYWLSPDTDSLWNELPEPDSVVSLLAERGIREDAEIILYAESEDFASWTARVFLTLDYVGMGDQTHVLNGGLDTWINAGNETTDKVPEAVPVPSWEPHPRHVVVKAMEVALNRHNPAYLIVDARSEKSYAGRLDSTGTKSEGGHIEGAFSLPASKLLSDSLSTRFRTPEGITGAFRQIGMEPEKTTIFYCGSGVRASVDYLAARHLGYRALVYDGSFQEWEKLGWPIISKVPEKTVPEVDTLPRGDN